MKLPRDVNGSDLAAHLIKHWDFTRVSQSGSHIKLRTNSPREYSATIPNHKPMLTGTFAGVLKQIAEQKQVTVEELLRNL